MTKVWLVLVSVSAGMAVTFGVSWPVALLYAAYIALYVILPGVVLYGVASTAPSTATVFAAKAAVVGQCVEMSVGLVASMIGVQPIYPAVPLLYVAGLLYWRRRILSAFEVSEGARPVVPLLASLAAAMFLVFAASLFNFDRIIDQHFTWVAAFASAALSKWPIPEPFLMDVPLHYHYLFNVHVGMAVRTLDIPMILVASRLAIVFHAFLFVLTVYAFCESRFNSGWLGAVAAAQMLLTFGYSAFMWQNFHLATASIMFRVASTIVAFEVFLVMCDEILGWPALKDYRPPLTLIVFMMLVASGTRASMLPVLVGGVGLLWLTHLHLKRERRVYLALLGAAMISIAAGALFFLGFGRGESDGTRLLFWNPFNLAVAERAQGVYSPIVEALLHAGTPRPFTALIYLAASVLGRTTFLLPGIIAVLVTQSTMVDRRTRAMLGGVALAGIAMLVLIESVVPQEIWAFYWYADIGLAVMGAAGMHTLWMRRATPSFWIRGGLLLSALLFAIQLWDFSTGFVPKLLATSLPTPAPVFRADPDFTALLAALDAATAPGDVLVTGGNVDSFDERVLPAATPGLQLYASRLILQIYGVRVKVDPRVASRMWLIENDLSGADARRAVRHDVGANRALYLLWLGGLPPDRGGLTHVGSWSTMSLWRVEG